MTSQELARAIETAVQPPPEGIEVAPARYALLVRPGQDPVAKEKEIEAVLAAVGPKIDPLSDLEPNVLVLTLPGRVFQVDDSRTFATAYALAAFFDLEAAEPDLPTNFYPEAGPRPTKAPADESIEFPPGCWAPTEPALDQQPHWALDKLRVKDAWQFSIERQRPDRGEGIIIAQPDTGITGHPELGSIPLVAARDVLDADGDPTDPLNPGNPGHGTSTASVAVSREAATVAGTAPKASHMPIRAIESVLRITQVTVAEAIDWAVANNAHVITMSLGGIPSFALHRAVRRAVAADVIVLAAAGNCVRLVVWPARYDDCIAVAGTDFNDAPWRGSCRGSAVDISAPAQNVIRAQVAGTNPPAFSVGQGQGTSFAVALTAGVAALWLAHHGRANLIAEAHARGETLQAMFRRLIGATARRPAEWDTFNMGAGILDARALLEADLDAGRDRESAPQPDTAVDRDAIAIESMILEAAGPEAVGVPMDWQRFGPEIATRILRERLLTAPPPTRSPRPESVHDSRAPVSSALAEALARHPVLRERLGVVVEHDHA